MSSRWTVRAAETVRGEFSLTEGWLNDEAKRTGLVDPNVEVDPNPVFVDPPIIIRVPSHVGLLSLKLAAVRGEKDLDDIGIILSHMRHHGWASPDDAWNVVGRFVPLAKRKAARYHLDAAWDAMNER